MPQRVLIVEDDFLNRMLFSAVLAERGFVVEEVADERQALSAAEKFNPDLIIMDIQLPEVSGLDLTRWIKDDKAINDIPIMAVTAFAMRQDERLGREAGCEAYMSKPIQMMPFIDTVRKLTGPRSMPPPRSAPPTPRRAMR